MRKIDSAHTRTERELKTLERKTDSIYKSHVKKIQALYEKFFSQFESEDEEMRKKLEAKEITRKEYKEWQINTIIGSKQFKVFQKEVAKELLKARKETFSVINSTRDNVYIHNYNFVGKRIQKQVK